ncbi:MULTISPECIES: hypothetical protein [unclassified Rhizobium]|jgi:hypothetical protein|uniref:hypothetical protein n=1 Tax=unclassified Rhizobium TaxID=2613769 RepID=UPI000AA31C89|nr:MULTISPECIES: hypothetical protein [unclassified Rhizobium]RKD50381.1 hypothetical protein BJ928_12251 [Rhizobium sp. WW_1]
MELVSVPANEDGPSHGFGVLAIAIMTRRPSFKEGDDKNTIATMAIDPRTAATLSTACIRSGAKQAIDLKYVFALPTSCRLASLSRSGVFRARTWSPTRPANRLCLRPRSQILASSIWSVCWPGRPHVTSFKPKQTAGRETASRSKEVAS